MELIDIFDKNARRTGKTIVRGQYDGITEDDHIFLVHLCIFNKEGSMLIQHRSPNKDSMAGLWDLSSGGFMLSGEETIDAVKREATEELGITDFTGLKFALRAYVPHAFDDIYVMVSDIDLKSLVLDTNELSEVKWAGRDEVLKMSDDQTFVNYDRKLLCDIFDVASGIL